MGERLILTGETIRSREVACAVGGAAVATCVECPAAFNCPILQLRQRSQEVVMPPDKQLISNRYDNDGGGMTEAAKQMILPMFEPDSALKAKENEQAAARQAAIEKAVRTRMNQSASIPQKKPNQLPAKRTYLELLMDSVVEFVIADSVRQQ